MMKIKLAVANKSGASAPPPKRAAAIRYLRDDRRLRIFPFLELPAEIRNAIYTELLTLRRSKDATEHKKHCYPQILATCKQIYKEAHDLVNAHSEAAITIIMSHVPLSFVHESDYGIAIMVDGQDIEATTKAIHWPTFLKTCEVIKLSLHLEEKHPWSVPGTHETRMERMRNTLETLLDFLFSDRRKISELHVEMFSNLTSNDTALFDMLSPACTIAAKAIESSFFFKGIPGKTAKGIRNYTERLKGKR